MLHAFVIGREGADVRFHVEPEHDVERAAIAVDVFSLPFCLTHNGWSSNVGTGVMKVADSMSPLPKGEGRLF